MASVYAAALADRKHLHTFRNCMISSEELKPVLRRNPHIIACMPVGVTDFSTYLHCNRVSQNAAHGLRVL